MAFCSSTWAIIFQEGVDIVKVCVLASSSSGNSTLVATDRTRVLIDAGLSCREITKRMAAAGEDIAKLDAILVTHEHSDHIAGLASIAKKHKIPVYLTHLAAPYIDWNGHPPPVETFQSGCRFSVGEFDVASFGIPHDAVDPVGYSLTAHGIKVAIATDLGYVSASLPKHLENTDLLLLESNHDLEMLRIGPYPWSIKQRVMSRRGHLSNDAAATFIKEGLDTRVSTLVLGHISAHNNYPALVRRFAERALDGRALFTRLVVADPGVQSEVFTY